ncbi:MAG: hypothetical protein FWD23_17000, partial [Oscillospiraceae bacterium]|nr:hypothetical protein [Oscillospiraceae bacterium]
MTPDELMIKAVKYQYPGQIPVDIGILPAAFIGYGDKLKKLLSKYSKDLVGTWYEDYEPERDMPASYRIGQWTDEWGCIWSNANKGFWSIVTGHPVKTRQEIHDLQIPVQDDGLPHGFMYLRILDLRGFEEAMIDFFEEPPELQMLIDKILAYNIRQTKQKLEKDKNKIIYFGDDFSSQNGMVISADKWRKYIKPCLKKIFGLCVDGGRLVYMHTDGYICEIMQDLYECGADIINPELGANPIGELERICKGKIPIALYFDQRIFPYATPDE